MAEQGSAIGGPAATTRGGSRGETEGFDPRAQARVLFAYKWLILAVVAIIGGGVSFWTLRQPRIYEATCTLEYDPNPPRPLGQQVEDVAQPMGNFWQTREFFETQNRIIASRAVAERVVRHLGLNHDAAFVGVPPEQRAGWRGVDVTTAAEMLRRRVQVEQVRDTRLVNVRVQDAVPAKAQILANAVADAYVDKTMEDRMGSTSRALEWLGQQVDTLRNRLEASETSLHEFKREHGVLSVSVEDRQSLVATEIEKLSEALTESNIRRIALQARAAELRDAQRRDPLEWSPVEALPAVQSLRERLRTKMVEREAAAQRYGEAHPKMQALETEIRALTEDLREEVGAAVQGAESELAEVRRTETGIRAALADANDRGLELNLWEIEYGRLTRERESGSKVYDLVLKRTAETDLTRMLRVTYVRIVDRALVPTASVSPRVRFNITLGLLAGLVLGVILALAIERMDRRIRSVEDIEQLDVAVLGLVPRIDDEGAPRGARRRGRKTAKAVGSRDLIAHEQPMSTVAESLRAVRTNLAFMGVRGGLRSFTVTSAAPREGKSTVVINLATSIAQSGKKVLLVDTDLRRPRLHRAFSISPAVGITSVLIGDATFDDAVRATEVPGLDLMPCGPIPPNPSELLHTDGFKKVLATALSKYDHVIFDSPPVGAVTDAAIIAPQLDGVIIVVKAQSTTREALRGAVRQLRDVGANILGSVLNDVDLNSGRYGESYYYYRRSGYYTADSPNDASGGGDGDAAGGGAASKLRETPE